MTDDIVLAGRQTWQDPSLEPGVRAVDLLNRMTSAEKIAQLGSTWPGQADVGGDVAPMQETFSAAEPFEVAIESGLGHLTRPFGTAPISAEAGMRRLVELQGAVIAGNRFGIPAIAHEECLTGFTAWTATIYPTALAWGATFDPALVRSMAARIGSDMAAVGVHQGLSPVLDVTRDYRWGRVEETIGEDPVLVGEIGTAYVEGLEGEGIIATLKHFAGYSASRGARNHAPVAVGVRELQDVLLPPFRRAINAGARSVMNSYAEIDGVPPASDSWLLTRLLRDDWGFTGTVVADYWAIPFLETMHRVATSRLDAGRLALSAGIDIELPHTSAYEPELVEAVSEDLIDRAALRVLTQKAALGLLDPNWTPPTPRRVDLDSAANRRVAATMAEESIVLLANPNGILPFAPSIRRIAVIGPAADDQSCLFGCYAFPNHVLPHHPDVALGLSAPTFLESIREEFPVARVDHLGGVDIMAPGTGDIPRAVELASNADVVILMVGDRSGMFGRGTSGEGCDAIDLHLPGDQELLIEAVLGTGTPTVLAVNSGRPYAIGEYAMRASATLQLFFPGVEGGRALSGILSGRVEPSGRLPVQIPGRNAPNPGTYLAPPLALKSDGVSSADPTPAFPFGHGIGYGSLEIRSIVIDQSSVVGGDEVMVSVEAVNAGHRPSWWIPQLYLSDPVASVTRPLRRLIGFARIRIEPNESAQVDFRVPIDVAGFTGRDLLPILEPGTVVLTVAQSAGDTGLSVEVQIIGEPTVPDPCAAVVTAFGRRPLPQPAL